MQLDSYLEIFTTMYGWAFANIIGEALSATGLIIVPFMLIVFNAWRDAKESGTSDQGVVALIDSVSIQLVIALFVFSVCFATSPLTSLLNVNLTYTPPATATDPTPQQASRDTGTGTTFDTAMANSLNVNGSMSSSGNLSYVPAWWFAVMSISSGFNSSFRAGLTQSGSDMRMVEDLARNATIEDPKLLNSIQQFYSQCFIPARSHYLSINPSTDLSATGTSIISASNTDYGPTDVDWMGSQLFRTEPGFYLNMRSTYPVPGFPVDFTRDTDYYDPASGIDPPNPGQINPDWGRPTCAEWWLQIRSSMVNASDSLQKLQNLTHSVFSFSSEDKATDEVARLAATKANPQFVDPDRLMGASYDTSTTIGRNITTAVSYFGVGKEALFSSMSMPALMSGLPMAQALMLMGLYMLMPLMVFFGGYDLRAMLMGTMGIFTVKFFAVLWAVAQWVE